MSAQPSPGPSQAAHTAAPPRPKYPPGIQAGAQEEKYRQKTRTLRKKIREIEAENDKVYAKTLQAKRNIQRLRIERAILYERLSASPQSPRAPQQLPHTTAYAPLGPVARAPYPPPGPDVAGPEHDLPPADYYRHAPPARRGPDGPMQYAHPADLPPVPGPLPPAHSSRHAPVPPPALPPPPPPAGLEPRRAYPRSPADSRHYAPPPEPLYAQREYAPAERYRGRSPTPPPPPPPPSAVRSVHAHQRLGPGTNINNVHNQPELEAQRDARDRERVREWEEQQQQRRRAPRSPTTGAPYREHEREREYAHPDYGHPPEREYAHPSAERDYAPHPHPPPHLAPPPTEREYEHAARGYDDGRGGGAYPVPPPEEANGRTRSGSMSRGYYEREYEHTRGRYHDASDVGAAETMQRMRSGSSTAAQEYRPRGRSVDSDVDMDERGAT